MKLFSTLFVLYALAVSAVEIDPDASIPRDGLALWITGESTVVEHGEIGVIKDRSGKGNDARRGCVHRTTLHDL